MNWKKVKLGSILKESKVVSEFPDTNKRIKVRLKVLGVEKRGIENEVEGATKQFVRKAGQFIYGKQNFHKGAFGIIPKELDGFESSSDLPAFDVDKSCLPEFLFYFFKQGNYYLELSKIASGVATQRINTSQLFDLEISLPEIEIQKTLLKNIKILENNGGEISSELTHQLDLIKQMRQAFLREAMQGKLVKSTNIKETGQQLLAKIKAEKAQLIADKVLKKEKEFSPITEDEIPFEIPEHWAWCRLGEIALHSEAGKSYHTDEIIAQENEWAVIKTSAITSGNFEENENKRLPFQDENLDKIKINVGDLLFCRASGSKGLAGKSCLVNSVPKAKLILSDKSIRYILPNNISKNYIQLFNSSLFGELYYQNLGTKKSTTMNNITREQFNNLTIPLPPLHEQEQIVVKLEELMAFCEDLEQTIKESQGYNEMVLQQVLREALQN